MKSFFVILLILTLSACGIQYRYGKDGTNGVDGSNGTTGAQGPTGQSGTNGSNGHNSLLVTLSGAPGCVAGGKTLLVGTDLDDSTTLEAGEVTASAEICNGQNGADGVDGEDGQDGTNGVNGTNGADAPPTALTPVEIVDPCGDAPGVYDEVFVRLQNGTLLASFSQNSSGLNTRFSVLVAGNYMTTDGDNCTFSVNGAGVISNENHHY